MRLILQLCLLVLMLLGAEKCAWGKVATSPQTAVRDWVQDTRLGGGRDAPPRQLTSGEAAAWDADGALAGYIHREDTLTMAGSVVVTFRGTAFLMCSGAPPPFIGSFRTTTLAWVAVGPNVYAYVKQNPWTGFDPRGLKTKTGELYVVANHDEKKVYIGQARRKEGALGRLSDKGHPAAELLKKEGTQEFIRDIEADDDYVGKAKNDKDLVSKTGGDSARIEASAKNRNNMAAEHAEYQDWKKNPAFKDYEFINDEGSWNEDNCKKWAKEYGTRRAGNGKVYVTGANGAKDLVNPSSSRTTFRRALAGGGAAAIGIMMMYWNSDSVASEMIASSIEWQHHAAANPYSERFHELTLDIVTQYPGLDAAQLKTADILTKQAQKAYDARQ